MKRYLHYALAAGAISLGLVGVASAQTTKQLGGMSAMRAGATMGHMQRGNMMSMMMGRDPVAACSSMMTSVSANPKLHQQMNAIMRSQMGSAGGVRSTSPKTEPNS